MINELVSRFKNNPDKYLISLLVFLLPFERIPSLDAFGITWRLSLVVAVIIIFRALFQLHKNKWKLQFNYIVFFALAFLIWLAILVPASLNFKRGLSVFIFDAFSVVSAFSIGYLFKKEYLQSVVKALFFSASTVLVFGVYQYFGNLFGLPNSLTGIRESYSWKVFGFPRIQSTALEPLYFASYLLLPLSFILVYLLGTKKVINVSAKKLMVLAVAIATMIFLTVSRGGVLGMIALTILAAVIMLILRLTKWKKILTIFGLIILGFLISLIFIKYINKPPLNLSLTKGKSGVNAYTSQLAKTGLEGGGDDRAKFRGKALAIWKTNTKTIVVGLGPGQFGPYIQNNHADPQSGWTIVNNLTLEILVESGIVGLFLFTALIASLLYYAFNAIYGERNSLLQVSMVALTSYVVAILIQYQTFSTLYIMHFWTAIGLLMGLAGMVVSKSTQKVNTM